MPIGHILPRQNTQQSRSITLPNRIKGPFCSRVAHLIQLARQDNKQLRNRWPEDSSDCFSHVRWSSFDENNTWRAIAMGFSCYALSGCLTCCSFFFFFTFFNVQYTNDNFKCAVGWWRRRDGTEYIFPTIPDFWLLCCFRTLRQLIQK